MEAELQSLAKEGAATDSLTAMEVYRRRTSDAFSEEWSDLFATLDSPEFGASAAGVPQLDRTVEIDDFANDFDTSREWPFAQECIRFTDRQSELIAVARRVAEHQKPAYFPILFQSIETLLPEVQHVRTIAWVLRTDAQVAIHLGDDVRAFDDIVALMHLSKHVDALPFLVSKLTGIAIRRIGLETLQEALRVDLLRDGQLLEISELLTASQHIGDRWKSLMMDEMSVNLEVFQNPNMSMNGESYIPPRGHDAVYFINTIRKASEIPTDDWQDLYESALEMESDFDQSFDSFVDGVDHILSGLLMPAFGASAALLINDAQMHRQAVVAVSLRLYQHRHGRFPSDLNEMSLHLEPPYGGRPFGYSLDRTQASLWGFWLSSEQRVTPARIPDTELETVDSLNNRAVVWTLNQ